MTARSMVKVLVVVSMFALGRDAFAYEVDIHYSATYALARAVGWLDREALTIASANQAVDENKATVAALEVDSGARYFAAFRVHQVPKNFRFHCFRTLADQSRAISSDVVRAYDGLFPARSAGADSQRKTEQLVQLGVALHCMQDAYSHNGYGGECNPYDGSCAGHTFDSLFDGAGFSRRSNPHS